MKNEQGFTLIEMLVVLLIISVLILVTIPNVTKYSETIDDKGCEAYEKMLSGQVTAYKLQNQKYPTTKQLYDEKYIKEENPTCPNGDELMIDDKGIISIVKKTSSS